MANRRDFLKSAGVLTLGAALMPQEALAKKNKKAKPGKKRIGLQTYTLGGELTGQNLAESFNRLRQMGYTHVELAGFKGLSPAEYKRIADDAGIKITSAHLNPSGLKGGEKYGPSNIEKIKDFWKRVADEHAAIGVPYLVQPGLPHIESIEDAQRVAEVFNAAGEVTKRVGIQFGYHNHNREFFRVEAGGKGQNWDVRSGKGRQIEEIFISETDPQKVIFELDVYWAVMGGQDPVEWINKYADRIQMLHIKDRLVLGQSGMMNFEQIFKNFYAHGHKDFFVEIEDVNSGKQFQRAEESINYLLAADFVK